MPRKLGFFAVLCSPIRLSFTKIMLYMFRLKRILQLALVFFYGTQKLWSQNSSQVEMADAMRSSGKIYVLLAVILVIFAGMIALLIYMERRLKRVEDAQKANLLSDQK